MLYYIRRRLLPLIPVFFAVSLLAFLLLSLPAEDAADIMFRESGAADAAALAQIRADLGLDRPLPLRYLDWLLQLAGGNMGVSYFSGRSVSELFRSRIPVTMTLAAAALLLSLAVSLPLAAVCAVKRSRPADYLIRLLTFPGLCLPGFLTALLLIYLFSLKLRLLPVLPDGSLRSFILPAAALSLPMAAKYTRYLRSELLQEMERPYVRAFRAWGVPFHTIFLRFILRSACAAMLPVIALSTGYLLAGTAVIETVFMLDGVGSLAVNAMLMKDYPIVQAYVLWCTAVFAAAAAAGDLLHAWIDPAAADAGKDGYHA